VAFAIGAAVLFIRKAGGAQNEQDWAEFPLLLVLAVPVVMLYALGVRAGRRPAASETAGPQPWQGVLLLVAVLLSPVALFQLVETIGGDTASSLNQTWIALVMAGLAAYASLAFGAVFQALVASLALVVAWLSLTDAVLDEPSLATFRWLLIVAAVALIAGSMALRRRGNVQAPELITAAGIAAVLAGLLGVFESLSQLTGGLFTGAADAEGQSGFWDVVLLVVSLTLVGYGARVGSRGPAYVGAFGLLSFTLLVGLELSGLLEGDADGKLVGWPLLLLLAGGAALIAGLGLGSPGQGSRPGGEPPPTRPMEGAAPSREPT
jgi:hypothetical protein